MLKMHVLYSLKQSTEIISYISFYVNTFCNWADALKTT